MTIVDGAKWPALEHWTHAELLRRHGDADVTVSALPYARAYAAHETRSTLRDYVARHVERGGVLAARKSGGGLEYVFDAQILARNSALRADVEPRPSALNFSSRIEQFYVGPAFSGAHPHFHGDAWNALVYGSKLWVLFPPQDAFFAATPALKWFMREYPKLKALQKEARDAARGGAGERSAEAEQRAPRFLECVQMPGDVVYVPKSWGHATLNLAPSVGVAVEFVPTLE